MIRVRTRSNAAAWELALVLALVLSLGSALPSCLSALEPGSGGDPPTARDLGGDAETLDLGFEPGDLGPAVDLAPAEDSGGTRDIGESVDGGSPEELPCPAQELLCGSLRGICLLEPDCENCPLPGCSYGLGTPEGMTLVRDACGGGRAHLFGASSRLSVRELRFIDDVVFATFGFAVDGQPTSSCVMEEMPTGAIRWSVVCGEEEARSGTAVFEPWGAHCDQGCPEVGGCYEVFIDEGVDPQLLPPEEVRIFLKLEQRGCSLTATLPAQGLPALSVLEPDGAVSLHIISATLPGDLRCVAPAVQRGSGPLRCTLLGMEGVEFEVLGHFGRTDEGSCE